MVQNVEAVRSEDEIFSDLAELCVKPGYVHALVYLAFRENIILFDKKLTAVDLQNKHDPSRLIRTEITTLLGLLVKAEIDWTIPQPSAFQAYIDTSVKLLEELHRCMERYVYSSFNPEADDACAAGATFREPIFYGGESAYSFQYLDLAVRKYEADESWLQGERGFSIAEARKIATAIENTFPERFATLRDILSNTSLDQWTMLPCFAINAIDIAKKAGLSVEKTERVLSAFTLDPTQRNETFAALSDFNVMAATPLIRMPTGEFLLLQFYSLAEALYDVPFYWMLRDKQYHPTLTKNRGDFLESFISERLALVFSAERVFSNVDIQVSRTKRVGEIDVLVVWGNRAIIVQAKSKRLTIEARKGNDQVIRNDFKLSVQDAYDQGALCAQCLGDKRYILKCSDGRDVSLPYELSEVYIFCIVNDHYPALSFQSRQFLKATAAPRLLAPLVIDVFTLDVMTEFLQSPLHFLAYVSQRSKFSEQIMASHELTMLAVYLRRNLWVEPGFDQMRFGDDLSSDLDLAIAVRRMGVSGIATPPGILTLFDKNSLGQIIRYIESRPDPPTIDLGLFLLSLGEKSVNAAARAISRMAAQSRADGRHHDLTIVFADGGGAGFTIHCSRDEPFLAVPRLLDYCERRKYKEKATHWFGIWIDPRTLDIKYGVSIAFPWANDAKLESRTKQMQQPVPMDGVVDAMYKHRRQRKVGRNDQCPCGSGLKHKKCCL